MPSTRTGSAPSPRFRRTRIHVRHTHAATAFVHAGPDLPRDPPRLWRRRDRPGRLPDLVTAFAECLRVPFHRVTRRHTGRHGFGSCSQLEPNPGGDGAFDGERRRRAAGRPYRDGLARPRPHGLDPRPRARAADPRPGRFARGRGDRSSRTARRAARDRARGHRRDLALGFPPTPGAGLGP